MTTTFTLDGAQVALLPCPFCGSVDLWLHTDGWDLTYVECNGDDCGTLGPSISLGDTGGSLDRAKEMAAMRWNNRPVEASSTSGGVVVSSVSPATFSP